jgi:DNA-binding IclR family transcriptional regulator
MSAVLTLPKEGRPALAKPVGAVTSAIEILRCLGRHAEPRRLSEITRELSLNPSTALNILRTLEYEGLVALDRDTRRYSLDQGLADLAAPLLGGDDPRRRFALALEAAAAELGVTVALWRRAGAEVELEQVAESDAAMRIAFTVGRRLPMFLGAMGRLVAARGDFTPRALRAGFDRVPWASAPDYDQWLAEVAAAREAGVGIDRGHVNRGVIGIAVPVETSGSLNHVIAAAMFETNGGLDPAAIVHRLKAVAAFAAEIPGVPHA